jgi:predicted amidohydrolase YtcJ
MSLSVPLLHDFHSHVSLYAAFEGCPDLVDCDAKAARATLAALPRDQLTVVRGWLPDLQPLTPADLARLPPAFIATYSLHGCALTDAALPLLENDFPDLVHHRSDRAWGEANLHRLFLAYARIAGLTEAKLQAWMKRSALNGYGSVEDMAVTGPESVRVIAASPLRNRIVMWATPPVLAALTPDELAHIDGIKLFLDGDIGSHTAAIRGGWQDGAKGLLLFRSSEHLARRLAELHSKYRRLPVAIHVLGDRAIHQAINAIARLERAGVRFPSVRLEHVQFITPVLARQARDLGIRLSMQPNFTIDSVELAPHLTQAQQRRNNPFRMLIDDVGFVPGKDLLFGSDGMPQDLAFGLRWGLFPPFPGQRLTLDELLAGHGPAAHADRGAIQLYIDHLRQSVTPVREVQ